MGPDHMCGILAQALMALLVIKEQIGSARAIHLYVFQLPKNRVTLQYVHDHPRIPGECGRMGLTRAVSHRHLQHHGIFLCWGFLLSFPNTCQHIEQPLHRKSQGFIQRHVLPLVIYISPESSHLLESITGAQQLILVIYKFNL